MYQEIAHKNTKSHQDILLEKDRWSVSDLGLEADRAHSSYFLDFSKISLAWLKITVKRFVRFQSATRSYSTCRSYIQALTRFNKYLVSLNTPTNPVDITRNLVVGYIQYLKKDSIGVVTRRTAIIHLRTFHLIVLQENWLPWPERPLVYSSDIPKDIETYPRFIPNTVISQLKKYLYNLSPYMQRFTIILLETGRRISEVCSLQVDCLSQDDKDDWYMKVTEVKLKKTRLIPISKICVNAIQEQQEYLKNNNKKAGYLFPARRKSKSPHISARHFNTVINKLAQNNNIRDENNKVWRFQAHQFRHTVGTNMINNGVSQVIVQKYLGHESAEMTAKYAHVHDATLKKAFKKYECKLIDIHGEEKKLIHDAQWLKKNISSQALPNGVCALPLTQKACPHSNACLTCTHFCTSKEYLPEHEKQLLNTNKIITQAQKNGWERIVEMNTVIAKNLELIIDSLKE